MYRVTKFAWLFALTILMVSGCLRRAATPEPSVTDSSQSHYHQLAKQIEYPDHSDPNEDLLSDNVSPKSLKSEETIEYVDMSLEEVLRLAMSHSRILRDLGGTVLRTPDVSKAKTDPSIVETDPRLGIEGALSAYDAMFTSTFSYEHNDRALNNVFFGGGTRLLDQNFATSQTQITKTAATGTQFALRNYTQYDQNNAPGNEFPGAYTTWYDVEARQPLLKGFGTTYNRLAGPNAQPGSVNGVVIARINSDIALADFELGVRNFASDVENTYWDLYYAYRDLEAKVAARNIALETWRRVHALYERGRRGGEAEKEAQAREQYFRFEEEAQNALNGKLFDGTRTNNGSTGGTFRGLGGVYVVERRLRLLAGLTINDGKLIRPSDEPTKADVVINWESAVLDSLAHRPELRRQKWQIKRREAELEANKNFLKPQFDATGRYRWRGFGQDLLPYNHAGEFGSAYSNLVGGAFQEWQAGFEVSFPIGFRQAWAAVRQAEMRLVRERSLLREQERSVIYDLSNAISDCDRAHSLLETNANRRKAAAEQVVAVQTAYESDNASLDSLLDAHRRLADASMAYYRSRVEYQLSIKNVHLEKGTLLEYNEIFLNEGAWPSKAYDDAEEREMGRGEPHPYRPRTKYSPWVSRPAFMQFMSPSASGDYSRPATPTSTPTPYDSPSALPNEISPLPPAVRESDQGIRVQQQSFNEPELPFQMLPPRPKTSTRLPTEILPKPSETSEMDDEE